MCTKPRKQASDRRSALVVLQACEGIIVEGCDHEVFIVLKHDARQAPSACEGGEEGLTVALAVWVALAISAALADDSIGCAAARRSEQPPSAVAERGARARRTSAAATTWRGKGHVRNDNGNLSPRPPGSSGLR